MDISPDSIIFWEYGFIKINATLVFSWVVIVILTAAAYIATRKITSETSITRWQNMLEVLVNAIREQIRDISGQKPERYLPFAGTIFIYIAVSNILAVVPWFEAPTASLSTTAALALCVFVAVPAYGISQRGMAGYLKQYLQPSVVMLPFNIISEVSRTLALAIRLYGNIMSGTIIAGILLGIVPFFFPVIMQAFGLLTGVIQAYIFAVLSMVYIASASKAQKKR